MKIIDNIDRITHIPKDWYKVELPAPKSVKIELSPVCNYRCGFCALTQREKQPGMDECMSIEFFCSIVQEMKHCGVEEIGLFYLGESLMNKQLTITACRAAKQIGIPYVFLTTNGSRCDHETAKALFEAGLDSLKFSITSYREKFREITGVKEKLFDQALFNLENAVKIRDELGSHCKISASSIKYDNDHYAKMQPLVDRIKSILTGPNDCFYYLPLYSMADVATQKESELGYMPIAGNTGRVDNPVAPIPCWSVFTEAHIRSNGDMSFCCFDADGSFTVGNLYDHSFMELWNSEEFRKIRKAHLDRNIIGSKCENCLAYKQ